MYLITRCHKPVALVLLKYQVSIISSSNREYRKDFIVPRFPSFSLGHGGRTTVEINRTDFKDYREHWVRIVAITRYTFVKTVWLHLIVRVGVPTDTNNNDLHSAYTKLFTIDRRRVRKVRRHT